MPFPGGGGGGGFFRIGFGEKKTLGLKQTAGHSGRQAGQQAQLKK